MSGPRVWVGLGLGFIWTWLQQASHCADSSFVSGILVAGSGHVARSDSEEGGEARGLQAWRDKFMAMLFNN